METTEKPKTPRIPLEDADAKTLTAFAELTLGIEVKQGTNAAQLRAKIQQAMPSIKDVPALPEPAPRVAVHEAPPPPSAPAGYVPVEGENPASRPAAISFPPSEALLHPERDPKVKIRVHKTADKTRPRDVTIQNNGYVVRLRRGEVVDVPLRVYFTLMDAKEMARVDTDETHPITGMPIWSWEEVPSYPFEVLAMPSAEEIAAWQAATSSGFQKGA